MQGVRRPKKSERKRIRKVADADKSDGPDAAGVARTAADIYKNNLDFKNDGEGASGSTEIASLLYSCTEESRKLQQHQQAHNCESGMR